MKFTPSRILAALGVGLALSLGTNAIAAPVVVKFSHVVTDQTPKGQGAIKFKEVAEELLGDKVDVQIFPNSTLYGDGKEMQALLLGDVHLIAPSLSKFDRYTKKLQVFDLPFLFDDTDAVACFENGDKGRELLDSLEQHDLKGLAFWHNGMKMIATNKDKLQRPEDIKGLKFRIQSSDVLEAQFRALDANPQKMAFGEVYQALQTGVVDGQENTWSNMYSQKMHEVQKTIAESNHGAIDYLLVTNADWWNGLPDDIREGLAEAVQKATEYEQQAAADINAKAKQSIIDADKAKVVQLSDDDVAAWREAVAPVIEQFEDEIGSDVIAAARACNK